MNTPMGLPDEGRDFINRISASALDTSAVHHPYLNAFRAGDFPNVQLAFQDFAYQYGLYSANFGEYLTSVIERLENPEHIEILSDNLAEEEGGLPDTELPSEVLDSITGLPHKDLFKRFQEALAVNAVQADADAEIGAQWSHEFQNLCQLNQYAGIGAIGIGTELIVPHIYRQILEGLKAHSELTMTQRVFFDLHSSCDDVHAEQIMSIAEELAHSPEACEQIEYGVNEALNMRSDFWDALLDRAQSFPAQTTTAEMLPDLGYQTSL